MNMTRSKYRIILTNDRTRSEIIWNNSSWFIYVFIEHFTFYALRPVTKIFMLMRTYKCNIIFRKINICLCKILAVFFRSVGIGIFIQSYESRIFTWSSAISKQVPNKCENWKIRDVTNLREFDILRSICRNFCYYLLFQNTWIRGVDSQTSMQINKALSLTAPTSVKIFV